MTTQPTSEMIEAVARAIWDEMYPDGTSWDDWARQVARHGGEFDGRDTARRHAKAAIAAMGEFTGSGGEEG